METVKEAMEFAAEIESGKPLGPTFCKEWRDKATSAIVLLAHRVDELCGEVNDLVYRMNGWHLFSEELPEENDEIVYCTIDGKLGVSIWRDCAQIFPDDPMGYNIFMMDNNGAKLLVWWMRIPEFNMEGSDDLRRH
jgi:hypothetical protein